ncbi:cap-gly domain containing [Lecanosticta acicola]|uniref:Cap-gly domain containing n=1 Tax=Lecanosticta acicola TaxID=111012 RepID=A0AAI9EED0_9PEZI|nr:cap-gly domain containing [Lecanosticta acicola]
MPSARTSNDRRGWANANKTNRQQPLCPSQVAFYRLTGTLPRVRQPVSTQSFPPLRRKENFKPRDNHDAAHTVDDEMALQTPRQRGLGSSLRGPSFGNTNTASSPSLRASAMDSGRKVSMRAPSGQPTTPASASKMDGGDLELGDSVNVPGEMYGTVKFVGTVRGKNGKFVGVELDKEFAAKGKNDGDVDGTHYFTTTIPGAGIFLPVHRAEKRHSPSASVDSFPATPNTPSYTNGQRKRGDEALLRPSGASKFSQSVGPGVRPTSPTFKPKRPSLPRPESPFRRQPPNLAPSASQRGTPRPGLGSTTTPSKNFRATTNSRPSTATSQAAPPRSYSRTGSRLGHRPDPVSEEYKTPVGRNGSSGGGPSFSQPLRSGSRLGSVGGHDQELEKLRFELAERDKRLNEQAANLADMEASVKELSALIEEDGSRPPLADAGDETVSQLRQMLREKNEKITILTSEFDAHRADFRSTLDSLEMASTETERVYEEQKRDLIAQVEELTARVGELEELGQSKKEFDEVARQLKQLEEFVQELEEGLEDARRGEAEARGEVEFLRGEVERGRSELKREREKAAAAMNGLSSPKELEQKDDEIRGLKAIIHSFSTSPEVAASNRSEYVKGADEVHRLQTALTASQKEKEKLEQELEQLRRDSAVTNGHARNESELTATATAAAASRPRADTVKATFAEHAARRIASPAPANGTWSESVFCEMCSSSEHDTLDCTHFQANHDTSTEGATSEGGAKDVADEDEPGVAKSASAAPLSPGKEPPDGQVSDDEEDAEAEEAAADGSDNKAEEKWCALCEKDGHLAYECPDEQY